VEELCPDGIGLLSAMLRYDPAERISARRALQHRYFTGADGALPFPGAAAGARAASVRLGEGGGALRGDEAARRQGSALGDAPPTQLDERGQSFDGPLEDAGVSDVDAPGAGPGAGPGTGPAAPPREVRATEQAGGPEAARTPSADAVGGLAARAANSLFGGYGAELAATLLANEALGMPTAPYITHTRGVCADFQSIRRILVNWLVEVIDDDDMKSETLFLAVNYLDRWHPQLPAAPTAPPPGEQQRA